MTTTKITPAAVLGMAPEAAAEATRGLDEANRLVLIRGMTQIVLRAPATPEVAAAYGAAFAALGPARLKLHAWALLTAGGGDELECVRAVYPVVAPLIVTGVFGLPMGEAGIGKTPVMGSTDEDRADLEALRAGALDLTARYAALVEAARAAGTLVVEETV